MLDRIRHDFKRRAAFREYARNGWQSPWVKRNRLWDAIFHR